MTDVKLTLTGEQFSDLGALLRIAYSVLCGNAGFVAAVLATGPGEVERMAVRCQALGILTEAQGAAQGTSPALESLKAMTPEQAAQAVQALGAPSVPNPLQLPEEDYDGQN